VSTHAKRGGRRGRRREEKERVRVEYKVAVKLSFGRKKEKNLGGIHNKNFPTSKFLGRGPIVHLLFE
jgi:hypothetical protein